MRFGMLYEIQVPQPWHARSEYNAYHQVVEQVQLAEAVGFDSCWTVEHHFLREYSHCSTPEVSYGYLAVKTSRIRLGHGVVLLPFPYNIAARIGHYRQALPEAEPVGATINPRVAVSQLVHCAPTTATAHATASAPIMRFHEQVFAFTRPFLRDDIPSLYRYMQGLQGVDISKITFDHLLDQHMILVGDPAHCIERLYPYYEAGVDLVLCLMQLHTIPHATVMESIRLFDEHVILHFAALQGRSQKPMPRS